jgi:hypothetical protein
MKAEANIYHERGSKSVSWIDDGGVYLVNVRFDGSSYKWRFVESDRRSRTATEAEATKHISTMSDLSAKDILERAT